MGELEADYTSLKPQTVKKMKNFGGMHSQLSLSRVKDNNSLIGTYGTNPYGHGHLGNMYSNEDLKANLRTIGARSSMGHSPSDKFVRS